MLQELKGVRCLALDTEHNSQRSYLGVLCLLQLSTGACRYWQREGRRAREGGGLVWYGGGKGARARGGICK
jgi:hypothetical protein